MAAGQNAKHPFRASRHGHCAPSRAVVVISLCAATIYGGSKTNSAPERIAEGVKSAAIRLVRQIAGSEAPSFTLVEARTNGVGITAAPTNATVSERLLRRGASEGGEWVELGGSPIMLGTNGVSRVYASPGVISLGTMRHPALGASLPDGTNAQSLVALRMPLGIAPMQNWHRLAAPSRFWHGATPLGPLFTWENALLDRMDGVSGIFIEDNHEITATESLKGLLESPTYKYKTIRYK